MKQQKGYKNYVNYFKKWEGAGMLGLIMMAVGFLFLWVGQTYATYIMSILLMPGGLAIFLYGNIGRANETDMQNEIQRQKETIRFREVEEEYYLRKRVLADVEDRVFEGFEMREGLYLKKQKNSSLCSSEYTCAKMKFLSDAFYIKSLTFSFVSEEKKEETHEILFQALEDISIERNRTTLTCGKKQFLAKTCFLCLTYDGGKQLRLPAKDDIYTDEFAEELKRKLLKK